MFIGSMISLIALICLDIPIWNLVECCECGNVEMLQCFSPLDELVICNFGLLGEGEGFHFISFHPLSLVGCLWLWLWLLALALALALTLAVGFG